MCDLADPEWVYLQHLWDEHPQTNMCDMFDYLDDHTSEQMTMFANMGNRVFLIPLLLYGTYKSTLTGL
jgi:hypothetical protein